MKRISFAGFYCLFLSDYLMAAMVCIYKLDDYHLNPIDALTLNILILLFLMNQGIRTKFLGGYHEGRVRPKEVSTHAMA